jgi:hypothetical protein
MIKKSYQLFVFLVFTVIISCNSKKDSIHKLDRANGFQGLVLGDSAYSSFIAEVTANAYGWQIIEKEIFGNVLAPLTKIENLDHRFIYGVLMDELYAGALNEKVYMYSLQNNDIDSLSQQKLMDSLKVNFGNPTLSKDTTIFLSLNEKNQIKQKIWKGNKIKMVYEFGTSWGDNISRLQVIDISAENILDSISEKIDSLYKNPSAQLETLNSIGNINLNSTKGYLLDNNILEVNEMEISDDYTITNYRINYSQYLKPFFGIQNKNKYSFGDSKIINTDLEFFSKSDSLKKLTVSFERDEISYSDLLTILGKKFGKYSFEEKFLIKDNTYRRSYWLSENVIIELEDSGYYRGEVQVNFYVNNIPYSLYF